ncbi:MAG: cupin domain-containing protein [Hyalangium sp.]|uniref:cupin domain-containing protein n=1 Tax=Hyalangium sp. TaxID=2028555 RepID=UPI00389ACF1A
MMEELHLRLASHAFWDNRVLQSCRRGLLIREDYALIFSQYALLTCSTTRFTHALLAQYDQEPWSTRMTQALWQEGGAQPPEKRPATLFRRFLKEGLGVDVEALHFQDSTRYLVHECLDWCLRSPPYAAAAFLAFGLEAPIPRLYSVFVDGLQQAGISERHLSFFHQRMQADSPRASLLEELVLAHAREPGWFDMCLRALERALELQRSFFEGLFESVHHQRLGPLLERIQARLPLAPEQPEPRTFHLGDRSHVVPFFHHAHEQHGIDFSVDRVPFPSEVLETSVVRVSPGHRSEPREHAYEVLLLVVSGTGHVQVRGTGVDVKPGEAIFVPRWASHQAQCTGAEPLVLLTVTDHGLTRRAHEDEVRRADKLKRATGVDL